jgi:uncharacterized protein YndB with AHSA1/START domain
VQQTDDIGDQLPVPNSYFAGDLYAHNEIVIAAPVEVVFRHIQEAEKWPDWYSNSQHVRVHSEDKLLKKDTEWDWDTFGVHIKSHVNEFVVNSE